MAKKTFQDELIKNNVRGTIIFSKEGINGTISGKKKIFKKLKNLKNLCKIKVLTLKIILLIIFNLFIKEKLKLKKKLCQWVLILSNHKNLIILLVQKNGIHC